MAFAVEAIDLCGLSNKMHRQLLPKKNKVNLCLLIAKDVLPSLITNETEHISFKSGCVILVMKDLKGDWVIVLC